MHIKVIYLTNLYNKPKIAELYQLYIISVLHLLMLWLTITSFVSPVMILHAANKNLKNNNHFQWHSGLWLHLENVSPFILSTGKWTQNNFLLVSW